MTRIVVLGADGQVGRELLRAAWPEGTRLEGMARRDCDITSSSQVEAMLGRCQPDLVVNAAAYTAVDRAETDSDTAYAVNAGGVATVAQGCEKHGATLVHFSTDYVFDGSLGRPYREDDPVAPMSVYGASKLAGEERIAALSTRWITLRTSWVFSEHGTNFVKTMIRLGRERSEVRVVSDQRGCPTPAASLAAAVARIAERFQRDRSLPWGLYHLAGGGSTSWHGFAETIFAELERVTGRRPVATPITTADYPTPTRRPADSRLDCERIRTRLGIELPPWQSGLRDVCQVLLRGLAPQEVG